MASRNFLKQLRKLDRQSASYPYADSHWWEAWECVGDDPDDSEDWVLVEEGTLDACIQALTNLISMEVDQELDADGTSRQWSVAYDSQPQQFIAAWERRQQQRRDEIKKRCWREGQCDRDGWWHIHSVLDADQVAYEVKARQRGFRYIS